MEKFHYLFNVYLYVNVDIVKYFSLGITKEQTMKFLEVTIKIYLAFYPNSSSHYLFTFVLGIYEVTFNTKTENFYV